MIEFRRETKIGRFLDPRQDFKEIGVESEVRYDPLTGVSGRICHFAFQSAPPADLEALVETSAASCPFCPGKVETITPRYPDDIVPGGRLRRGQAVLFPNLFPYDDVSAIAVISRAHHHPILDMPSKAIEDGIGLARDFYRIVERRTRDSAAYGIVTWNFMPPAGASQVHPHMQIIHTANPGNGPKRYFDAARDWRIRHGGPFAETLVARERELGERWIGESQAAAWLVPFVPTGILGDCMAIFPNKATVADLSDDDISDFADGLKRVLAGFAARGLWSFNMVFIPDVSGAASDRHWLTVRLVPRLYINPALHVTDVAYMQLILNERFAMTYPEEMAAYLRENWPS